MWHVHVGVSALGREGGSRRVSGERFTAVLNEARAKLREWAVLAGKGWLLLSGSVVLALLKAAVNSDRGERGIKNPKNLADVICTWPLH